MMIFSALGSMFGGGAAAAGAGAAAAGSGFTISGVLQGLASVGGLVASIAAGNAEADQMEAAAIDAEREQALENLQGIDRRRAMKAAAADAIGEMDAAYAASGVDLSYGTARQARTEAYREADLGLTSDAGTQMTRISRLEERAANYRRGAKRAKMAGWLQGGTSFLSNMSQIRGRG